MPCEKLPNESPTPHSDTRTEESYSFISSDNLDVPSGIKSSPLCHESSSFSSTTDTSTSVSPEVILPQNHQNKPSLSILPKHQRFKQLAMKILVLNFLINHIILTSKTKKNYI